MCLTVAERNKIFNDNLTFLKKEHQIFVNKHKLKEYMSKEDLEDMFQEASISILKAIERYDPAISKPRTFLSYRMVGACKDYLKKRKIENRIGGEEYIEGTIEYAIDLNKDVIVFSIEDFTFDIYNERNIIEKLKKLTLSNLYIIVGYYILDRSIKEIAYDLNLNLSSGWIYKIKTKAIEQLKGEIEGEIE